jgi:hypothetical protein
VDGSSDWVYGDWVFDPGFWWIGSGGLVLCSGFSRRPVDSKMSSALAEPSPVSDDRSNWQDVNVLWGI